MHRQGQARLWREDSQAKGLGQDAAHWQQGATGESRDGFDSKHLLSTNNVAGAVEVREMALWIKT